MANSSTARDWRKEIERINQEAKARGQLMDPKDSLQPGVTQIIMFRKTPKYPSRKPQQENITEPES